MNRLWLAVLGALFVMPASLRADEAAVFTANIRPFLQQHCVRCHGPQKQEGDFRADALHWPIADVDQAEEWQHAVDRLGAGEMPPEGEKQPAAAELGDFLELAGSGLREAAERLAGGSNEVVLRRLNRIEYENTLRDLLGIHEPVHKMLPEDPLAHGFDKVGSALTLSAEQIETYLAAADVALRSVIAPAPEPPPSSRRRHTFHENNESSLLTTQYVLGLEDKTVIFSTVNTFTQVRDFRAPHPGRYRFRIAASTYQSDEPLLLAVYAGAVFRRNDPTWQLGFMELTSETPAVAEFETRLRAGDSFYPKAFRLHIRRALFGEGGKETYEGPGIAIYWMDIEGPINDEWPSRGHRVLFDDLPLETRAVARPGSRTRTASVEVVSTNPAADAERLLRRFLPRAFRRPTTDDDLRPFLGLALEEMNDHGTSFHEAMLVAYQAVLCSPEFLFLHEKPGPLDDYAIAARMSYFLWSSMPDDELLSLAAAGKLRDPGVRRRQVERMLDSPRSREFTRNFCGQWLQLREIDFTTPDRQLYPEHDDLLQDAMLQETELFFEEVLKNNLSLLNFVDSDWTILNRRLAEHYGIEGVEGLEFRKVALRPESRRGGVLTHASVLKVTANGTVTSPVLRGTWLLERMLGRPPAPPPPNVPAIEPDTRGAVTIREQYAAHRQVQACAACHAKIDPHGFALENFDVIGGWRDKYRSLGEGERVNLEINGLRVAYRHGPVVDAGDVLPGDRRFADIDEYKRLLLDDKDQIARALTEKLMIYALGRGLTFADRPVVEGIVERLATEDYGFRTLIHEIVASEPFVTK